MTRHRFLVIGQGSIGQRHARLLANHGSVACVSARASGSFRSVSEAVRSSEAFTHAVVANVTSHHAAAVEELAHAGFDGHLLIEKPVCASLADIGGIERSAHRFASVSVGYNLRFHPVIQALQKRLAGGKVLEARLSVGQLLSQWRPGSDYLEGSSAKVSAGGGVLRDLSHELDLALLLLGPWKRVVSMGGNFGRLGIQTDEAWAIILEMESGAMVSVLMNYFDRPGHRSISVTTESESIVADIAAGFMSVDGEPEAFVVERDDTYEALHRDFLSRQENACSLEEAFDVMRLIDGIERSAEMREWIER